MTKLNKVPMSPEPLTPEMAKIVREELRPDVMHMSELLGRDLSFWLDNDQ